MGGLQFNLRNLKIPNEANPMKIVKLSKKVNKHLNQHDPNLYTF